tara:strand:- start:651 stop:863 length:213 start_codon:yes stop_codon:yes gene_type:complete
MSSYVIRPKYIVVEATEYKTLEKVDHDIIANFDDLETARRLVDIRSEADQLQGFSYKRYMVYSIQEEDGK